MQKIYENFKEFWGGVVGGSVTGGGLVYFGKIVFLDYLGSLATVALSAIIGGMCTALAADYYKHKIKHKLFKSKQNGTDKEKAA